MNLEKLALSTRLIKGLTTPKMMIFSMCPPAALFVLMVLVCPSCGMPNIIRKLSKKCLNCQSDLFCSLISCIKHCGEWSCENGHIHHTNPGEIIERCGEETITTSIHAKAVEQVSSVARTVWLQIRGSLTYRNGANDFAGRPNPTAQEFIEIFWQVATDAAIQIMDSQNETMKTVFVETLANAEPNDLAAIKSSFALIPGKMSTFELEELEKDVDILLVYVPDEIVTVITKNRLLGMTNYHSHKWLGLNITKRLSLQFALEDINHVVGSSIIDPKIDFQLRIQRMQDKIRKIYHPRTQKDELKIIPSNKGDKAKQWNEYLQSKNTPMKDDLNLPSPSDKKFRIFSTPKNNDCTNLKCRSKLSDRTTSRIEMNYDHTHPLTSYRQLYSKHSSLLFRPLEEKILPPSETWVLGSDDSINRDWMSVFSEDFENICDQSTASISQEYNSDSSLEILDCNISGPSTNLGTRGRKRKWSEALGQAGLQDN